MEAQKKFTGELIDLLINIPIFDGLDSTELQITAQYMNIVKAPRGEVLFREGDKGDYVCFVAEGVLDIIKTSESGKHVTLSSLNKGRSIGEMAILDNFPRSASVRARGDSTLITLSRDGFNKILDDHPRIGIKILKGLARLLSLSLRKTSSRLADYMLPLS
ncbi:MAG: cyclic nucleotide-binding domain-containing protein [Pseudomonadota bacterium]